MAYVLITMLGVWAYTQISQELFPAVTFPQLTIVTPYPNAAPEEIETLVTKLIEESIATVKGLKSIHSFSREGLSMVIVEFNWGTDMNFASLNLREKIDLVKERLPRETEEPLVLKFNPFSKPIMIYSMVAQGDPNDPTTFKMHEILKIAKTRLKDKLEKIPGVASVSISGGQEREIQVDLDLKRLVAHKINILDVPTCLKDSNLNYPAGSVKEDFFEYLVRTIGEYKTIDEIKKTLVSLENIKKGKYDRAMRKEAQEAGAFEEEKTKNVSSQYVLLEDVANIQDGFRERASYSRYQGKENISLTIQKQASANVIQTVRLVRKELSRLQNETNILPQGIQLSLIYDASEFIKTSIQGVVMASLEGGVLAFLVLFFALRSLRAALIVVITIPATVLTVLIGMYVFDYTINIMSLGGLALGIGMLTDNSIVVVENIARYRSLGHSITHSTIEGCSEVFASNLSSVLTTIAVFLPLIFVVGIAGQLFKPISFTIVYSNIFALLIAITLIPMLTAMGFKKSKKEEDEKQKLEEPSEAQDEPIFLFMKKMHVSLLGKFLQTPKTGLFFILIVFLFSLFLFTIPEKEVMPKVDQGQFSIKITLPTGTVLDKTNALAKVIEALVEEIPDLDNHSVAVGANRSGDEGSLESLGSHQSLIIVKLKPEHEVPTRLVLQKLQDQIDNARSTGTLPPEIMAKHSGLDPVGLKQAEIIYTVDDNPFAGAFTTSAPIAINITGRDFKILQEYAKRVEDLLETIPGVVRIRNDIPSKSPEMRIFPDRSRAALEGISASDIAQTALIAVRGTIATQLKQEGQEVNVLVRVNKKEMEGARALETLKSIPLFVEDKIIPLQSVAKIEDHGQGPSEIRRLDQTRIYHVYADIRGRGETEVFDEIERLLKKERLEENYFMGFGKEHEDKKASQASILMAFLMSILLVYMVMAAQFESLWQPFIIMMTVPLSVMGAAFALVLTGTSVNAMSMLGMILLGGIVVNNGIILIQFINDLRENGCPLKEAILTGASTRMRPIIMTMLVSLLGSLPVAFQLEKGSEMQSPMAIVIIGGLLVSTCLTLFVIPTLYWISESFLLSRKRKRGIEEA
jgi:HAE1 family hydrophobic/amphiphilic exporter-1